MRRAEHRYKVADVFDAKGEPLPYHHHFDSGDREVVDAAVRAGNTMLVYVEFGDTIRTAKDADRAFRLRLPRVCTVALFRREICRKAGANVPYPSFLKLTVPETGEVMEDTVPLEDAAEDDGGSETEDQQREREEGRVERTLASYGVMHDSVLRLDIKKGDLFEALRVPCQPRGRPLGAAPSTTAGAAGTTAGAAGTTAGAAGTSAGAAGTTAGAAGTTAGAAGTTAGAAGTAAGAARGAAAGEAAGTAGEAAGAGPLQLVGGSAAGPAGQVAAVPPNAAVEQAAARAAARGRSESTVQTTDSEQETAGARRGKQNRRQRTRWTGEETKALLKGVLYVRSSAWKQIKDKYPAELARRTPVDLKDKWNNIRKAAERDDLPTDVQVRDLVQRALAVMQPLQ